MYGRKIKTTLDYLNNPISEEKSYSKYVKVRNIELKKEDKVMVREYLNPNKKEWKKGAVEEVLEIRIYLIILIEENIAWRRHVDQLTKIEECNNEMNLVRKMN